MCATPYAMRPYYTYYEAFSNTETQSGTTTYTLTDLARMREQAWDTHTLTQARCTQCQRYIPDTWHPTTEPAPTYVLCPECTHMRDTARGAHATHYALDETHTARTHTLTQRITDEISALTQGNT